MNDVKIWKTAGRQLKCAGSIFTLAVLMSSITCQSQTDENLHWNNNDLVQTLNGFSNSSQKLEYLDLSENQIANLNQNPFKKFPSLMVLNLSNNQIDDLPRDVFEGLNLEKLCLSRNKLQAIPLNIFAPIPKLIYLDLSYNSILSILDHFFEFNKCIEILLLNNNQIANLTSNALADLGNLKRLDLAKNSLSYISTGLFDSLNNLQYLNLANNPITNLQNDTFRGLHNLEELNLSGNRLQQLTYGLFHFGSKIMKLTLDDTRIKTIRNTDLLGLTTLQELRIRNNEFLDEIEAYAFVDTMTIKYLDISGNNLKFLPLSLANLTNLQYLNMGTVRCAEHDLLRHVWSGTVRRGSVRRGSVRRGSVRRGSVRRGSVRRGTARRIPLNIEHNPWVCDCRMFWFAPWVESRKSDNLTVSDLSSALAYPNDMLATLQHLNCTSPYLVYKTPTRQYRLNSNALLECRYSANPMPSITWITPTSDFYHWNPDRLFMGDVFEKHLTAHDQYLNPLRTIPPRILLLHNGTLLIQNVTFEDFGRYSCFASNPIANATSDVLLHIDPTDSGVPTLGLGDAPA